MKDMRLSAYWEWRKWSIGVEYVSGTFAHTFYIRLLPLTWAIFVEKKDR